MANIADSNDASPKSEPAKPGIWQRLRLGLIRTETEFAFFKGLTFVGFLGSFIVGYFQYISAYQDKVNMLAKEDLGTATSAFVDASDALSIPLSLQERLVFSFYDAVKQKVDGDGNAYVTKSARAMIASYDSNYAALRENVNLIGKKMEIYLDWASDLNRDAAMVISPTADPISSSSLGNYNFDCDNDMPSFGKDKSTLHLKDKTGHVLDVDWYSAKHNVLTIYYCFNTLHNLMEPVRQWASSDPVSAPEQSSFIKQEDAVKSRLANQVMRLNAFMGVAMNEIEQIRVKYRPNGFACSVPIAREVIFSKKCMPIRTSEG
jgi:hypothetical protein